MKHFEPKRGDGRPVWRVVFDEIEGRINGGLLEINDLIPHEDMRGLLNPDEQYGYYAAMGRAAKTLEEKYQRTLQHERGKGYRLCGGLGQVEKANGLRRRGRRNMSRALTVLLTVDHSLLSETDRTKIDSQTRMLGRVVSVLRIHHEKLVEQDMQMKELERQSVSNRARLSATDEEVSELRRRLDELERRDK